MQASRGARTLFRCCSSRLDHEERPPLVEVGDLRAGGLRAVPTAALLARSHLPRPERERRADDHGEDHDERVQLPVLYEVLAAHTRTSDDCYLCLWEGIGDLHPAVSASPSIVATASGERGRDRRPPSPPPVLDAPKVVVHDRKFLLFQGPLAGARDWGAADMWPGHSRGYLPAAFLRPADHAWCVAHDIDPHWAGIGADADVVDQHVAEARLDGVSADPSDEQSSFDWGTAPHGGGLLLVHRPPRRSSTQLHEPEPVTHASSRRATFSHRLSATETHGRSRLRCRPRRELSFGRVQRARRRHIVSVGRHLLEGCAVIRAGEQCSLRPAPLEVGKCAGLRSVR